MPKELEIDDYLLTATCWECSKSFTLEELYQAFKKRLLEENAEQRGEIKQEVNRLRTEMKDQLRYQEQIASIRRVE